MSSGRRLLGTELDKGRSKSAKDLGSRPLISSQYSKIVIPEVLLVKIRMLPNKSNAQNLYRLSAIMLEKAKTKNLNLANR